MSEAGKYLFRAVMCGGGVRSILLLPLVARCIETIYLSIRRMYVFISVVLTVGMFVVYRPLLKTVFLSLGVLRYVVFFVSIVKRGAVGARV